MTLVNESTAPVQGNDAQALIEEARRRQRRRHVWIGIVLAVVLALVAVAVTVSRSGGGVVQISTGSPQFATSVTSATKSARSADVTLVLRSTFLASVSGCRTPTVDGIGVIGFTNDSIGLHLANGAGSCGSPWAMQERQIGSVLYQTDPSLPRGVLTSPGRPWLKTPWATPAALPIYGHGGVVPGTTADFVFTVLRALRGPVNRIRTTSLHGITMTGYRATMTLRQLQVASHVQSRSSGATLEDLTASPNSLPPAVDIPISVVLWIDSSGRIRQLRATEPVYALNYKDGSGVLGPQIYPSDISRQASRRSLQSRFRRTHADPDELRHLANGYPSTTGSGDQRDR
jgi:hypothetical protein